MAGTKSAEPVSAAAGKAPSISPAVLDAVSFLHNVATGDAPRLGRRVVVYGGGDTAMDAARTAKRLGAAEIVDPRPYACGSIRNVFVKYQHVTEVLPAMGYGEKQVKELSDTIKAVPCDVVLIATPIDLTRVLTLDKPSTRATYELGSTIATCCPRRSRRRSSGARASPRRGRR